MVLASAGLSIEPKGQPQGQSPFLCSVGEVMVVACGSVHCGRPRALFVTADPLLCLLGRVG